MSDELEVINELPEMSVLEQVSKAEIDSQIATAKKYPRNIAKVRQTVLSLATMDEETAADCFFSLPRGGKTISGESVRFAEILAASYGNVKAAWRPIGFDKSRGIVTCQGVCIDLENNVSTSLEKTRQVQRKRGATGYDEDMITIATNACGAIAYRDAVFKTIPKAIVKSLMSQIKEAARGKGTLEQKVSRVLDRLVELGEERKISKTEVLKRAFHVIEVKAPGDIDLANLDTLIGIGTAIRDGEIRFEDALPDPKATPKVKDDPFVAAGKKSKPVTEENINSPQNETAPSSTAKTEPADKKAEVSEKSAKEPTGESYPEVNPDALAHLIMDTERIDDAATTKIAIKLSILPKDYTGSVMEAPQEAINAMVGRWSEIVNLNAK